MPKPPHLSANAKAMPGAVYSPFADRLEGHAGPLFPLHVGDTCLEPFEGARMQDIASAEHPGLHQYCDTRGLPELVNALVERVCERSGLARRRESVLVTAGATRNPLDSMRCITANSSGSTGVSIASALHADHTVHLLASPEAALRAQAAGIEQIEGFGSTRDLMARMERRVRANPRGIVIHAAAVGDYEARASVGKVSSNMQRWDISLTPTPKILDHVRGWGGEDLVLVSFKAAAPETSDQTLIDIARAQAVRTGSDLVFANVLGRLASGVALVAADCEQWFEERGDALEALVEHPLLDS